MPQAKKLIESGQEIIEKIHNYNPNSLVNIGFNIRKKKVKILTNTDVYAQKINQSLSANISSNLVQGEDFLQISSSDVVSLRPLDINKLISQLIQKYQWAENSAKITSGTFPVFFTPKAVGKAIARLWKTVLSGQAIVQKASSLANKVGENIFDRRFTEKLALVSQEMKLLRVICL
ncbi:metallopeptidase TldD-related protein [Dapis sp. BLCC M172]|uniref:metallopeptidase TldD-related protein n=1 Tax=Dapis sp. BLCC M172 TaxID=2975281 RepID=UPI003CEAD114